MIEEEREMELERDLSCFGKGERRNGRLLMWQPRHALFNSEGRWEREVVLEKRIGS